MRENAHAVDILRGNHIPRCDSSLQLKGGVLGENGYKVNVPFRLLVLPKDNIRISQADVMVTNDLREVQRELRERVGRWFEFGCSRIFFVPLDGFPGAGKTTLRQTIAAAAEDIAGVEAHILSLDRHIQTDRGSPLRIIKNLNPELFWQLYHSREDILTVLSNLLLSEGPTVVQLQKLYNRELGKVMQGEVKLPGGRKVVVVDGVNSTELLDTTVGVLQDNGYDPDFSSLGVFIHTGPDTAYGRAVNRNRGRGDTDRLSRQYMGEISLLEGYMSRNIANADIILVN